jgi:hypothetical protein
LSTKIRANERKRRRSVPAKHLDDGACRRACEKAGRLARQNGFQRHSFRALSIQKPSRKQPVYTSTHWLHLLVLFFLAPAEIVSVLVAPNDLATRDRKTTPMLSLFRPFQSKDFACVSNVHFVLRIGKGGQRKVQFNGRTDRWTDGNIHEYSLHADVSSASIVLPHKSLLIPPREGSGHP